MGTDTVKLKKYIKPYLPVALMAPVCMLIEISVDLMQPTLMARIVDKGVLGNNMQAIVSTGLLMLVLAIFGGMGGLAAAGFASAASQSYGADLRNDLFTRVMRFSFSQNDHFTTGSLVTRLTNDVTQMQDFVAQLLRMFIRGPLMFLGSIYMALQINIKFGLVIGIALPLQVLVVWLMISKTSPLYSIVQGKLDKLNAVVQENVTAARVVKAYVRESRETDKFVGANNELTDSTLKVQRIMAAIQPLMMIIMNGSVLAVIYIGGLEVQAKSLEVGQVMAVINYLTQILMSMMMISMLFNSVSRARASAGRIRSVLQTCPEITDGPSDKRIDRGGICFENVNFSYKGMSDVPVLAGIDMEIRPGETVALLGATGSGKTSLVSLIPRFYDPVRGRIMIDGMDLCDYKLDNLRKDVSIVLQKSELFSGTIRDNIRWGRPEATDDEVEHAAKIAEAHDFITSFDEGYDTVVGQKGSSLSGGQKQRIAIARALVKKPMILIMDDSTSAVDLATEADLREGIRREMMNMTVVVISSRIASVMNADRIAVLENGRLAGFGTHDELMASSPVYRDIYDSQMGGGAVNE